MRKEVNTKEVDDYMDQFIFTDRLRDELNILKTYPDLKFILIGDSGEHDADIYIEIAEEFPERIRAIYLRSVNHERRVFRVRGLLEKFKTTPALLVKDSEVAEDHARELGLIQ